MLVKLSRTHIHTRARVHTHTQTFTNYMKAGGDFLRREIQGTHIIIYMGKTQRIKIIVK